MRVAERESTESVCGDANEFAVNWYGENINFMAGPLSSDQPRYGGRGGQGGHRSLNGLCLAR